MNTDLVCDAINVAMRELFLQIARESQSAFSEGGLMLCRLEDLARTSFPVWNNVWNSSKGVRYLEKAEGVRFGTCLDENSEVNRYKYVSLGS